MLVEIILDVPALAASGFNGRDEIDEPLAEVLEESGFGEVTGGGSGGGQAIIDIELCGDLDAGIQLLRETLVRLRVPPGTVIKCHAPKNETHKI